MKRLSFMVSPELFERVELARGDVPRERWLRWAVEQALDVKPVSAEDVATPAPAEQPGLTIALDRLREQELSNLERIDASRVRPFRPYPKGGR